MGLEEEIKKTKRKLHSLNIEVIPKMPVYKKIPKSWFLWGVGILFLSFLGYTGITKIPFSQPSTKTPVRSSTYNPPNGSDLYQRKTGDLSKIDPTPVKIVNTKKKKDLSKIINQLGQEVQSDLNNLLFYIYDDGTVEKRITIEE